MRQILHCGRAPNTRKDDTTFGSARTQHQAQRIRQSPFHSQATKHKDTQQLHLPPPLHLHAPNQRHRQKHSREISDYVDSSRRRRSDKRIETRARRRGIPGLVHRRALENRHDDLGGAVSGHDAGDGPAGEHEITVGVEDAAVEKEGGEFDERCCGGVEDFDHDESLCVARG